MVRISDKKKELRLEIKKRQQELPSTWLAESDQKIYEQIINLLEYQKADVVFTFVSTKTEVDTRKLIDHALSQNKKVVVPRCMEKGIMELYEMDGWDSLEEGMMGILEPKTTCKVVDTREVDFALIPCLSCDRKGNRLGKGGGYYDRYLMKSFFIGAALCREPLLCEQVPMEAWDQPVDMVVTEKTIYRRNKE